MKSFSRRLTLPYNAYVMMASCSGVECGGTDAFSRARTKASSPRNAQVGPDSVPTLSFTSGGERNSQSCGGPPVQLDQVFWVDERVVGSLFTESIHNTLRHFLHKTRSNGTFFTPLSLAAQSLVHSALKTCQMDV